MNDALHISNPLLWVKGEIDRSVSNAREALARALLDSDARKEQLASCEHHLRLVRGAVYMLGLNGAARFCGALEEAVRSCVGSESRLTRLNASVIDRAMFALCQFLDDLAKGETDVPLKLFPVYRELGEIAGRTDVAENELFFPDLTPVPAPSTGSIALAPEEIPRHVITCRARFQRGLLAWLTQPNQPLGLQQMRSALDAIDQVAGQLDAPAGLWWAAAGLVDAVMQPDERVSQSPVRPIFGRIERLMRDVASGTAGDAADLLREILYPLALCAPVSRRVREVKNLYRLDAQVPEFCVSGTLEYDVTALAPVLDDMRRRLAAVEDAWAKYASGSGENLRRLRDEVTGLKSIARDLGHYRLVRLLDIVSLIASKLPDPYPRDNEILALEMAAAFLFMEGMLDHFTSPPSDIDQQVAVMVGWLLDAVKPRGNPNLNTGTYRDDITQRQQFAQIRSQVAHEILENLRQVEQTVDQIARDPALREGIATLDAPVRQIAGALKMLGLSRANGVLSACLHLMKLSVSDDPTLTRASLEWVADGLSCLGFYLDALERGESPSEGILLGFVQRLGRDDAHPAGSTGWIPAASDAPADETEAEFALSMPGSDALDEDESFPGPDIEAGEEAYDLALRDEQDAAEIEAVYIEEAHQVLAAMEHSVSRLRLEPADKDALAHIRRGFHTLKGSSRLIGLDAQGELAWALERTLNDWVGGERLASAELLDLVAEASQALVASARQLGEGAVPDVATYAGIIARAAALRTRSDAHDAGTLATAPVATSIPESARGLEVAIGDVRLSETLYQIYLRESAGHLATLETELELLESEPRRLVSDTLTRAAHTLKSSSRTTGLLPVAELSAALEHCLHRFEDEVPVREALPALRAACVALASMLVEIRDRRLPARAEHEAAQLREATQMPSAVADDLAADDVPVQPAAAADDDSTPDEELDVQLLPVFLDEAHQLLPRINADLRSWRARPDEIQPARALARALHTLKGSARMTGATHLGELTHALESRVGMAVESGENAESLFADLEQDLDEIAEWIDTLDAKGPRTADPDGTPKADHAPAEPTAHATPSLSGILRVDADVLDRLVNQAGEISIARARIEGEMETLQQSLHELTDSVSRLRTQLRETQLQADSQMQSRLSELKRDERDFDPLELDRYTRLQELTRMMAETLHDVQIVQHTLLTNSAETEAALAQQGRIGRELQQHLLELRSVPFGMLSERLQRTVRQTARQLGRGAELEIDGETIEIDRSVLQHIAAPLEHMLRNAIAHGIEHTEQRLARGKPEVGRIRLRLEQEGGESVLTLSDDGAGLDSDLIRLEALRLGLIAPQDTVADTALFHLIFAPGFSTAQTVTETSGRGIGLDVVRAEVAAIGGNIEVVSTPGEGTSFRIRFPLTLAASQVVLVRAGATYAIPSTLIEQVQEIKPELLASAYADSSLTWNSTAYPLHYLPRLLGQGDHVAEIQRHNTVLLLRAGEHRLAVHVDQVLRNQEVVLKSIGPQLARVPGVVGATVLGNGQVVLVLNPVQLHAGGNLAAILGKLPEPRVLAANAPVSHIMVVDDSLTVRRLTGRLLAREGYQVTTAKDGVEALQQMQETVPDLVILDIEMPRMDGLELAKQLRADASTAALPIIIVTSRMAEKHQRLALDLGVNAFFGKPYPEDELLACVAELLGRDAAAQAA